MSIFARERRTVRLDDVARSVVGIYPWPIALIPLRWRDEVLDLCVGLGLLSADKECGYWYVLGKWHMPWRSVFWRQYGVKAQLQVGARCLLEFYRHVRNTHAE